MTAYGEMGDDAMGKAKQSCRSVGGRGWFRVVRAAVRIAADLAPFPHFSQQSPFLVKLCTVSKIMSRYTTRKRAPKSHRLSETPIVWRNTSDTFTPRGLGYNRASCELVKCFELRESDGELRRSCLR